jgi:excisionase family DNA binding protein
VSVIGRCPGESLVIASGSQVIATIAVESIEGDMARLTIEHGVGFEVVRSEAAAAPKSDMNLRSVRPGQAAKAMGVAPRTVNKWIDRGQLKGYRLPGTKGDELGGRRIVLADLVAFAEARRIPLSLDAIVPRRRSNASN